MTPLIIPFPGNEELAKKLSQTLSGELARVNFRRFPDGETYLRVDSSCQGRYGVIVAALDHPDEKALPLIFLSETLRGLGIERLGLAASYLAYMRQDRQFQEGEGITSRYFAKIISHYFDWLVTVDPHLHRYPSLNEIYSIPTQVSHAAPIVSDWIRANIEAPLLIGPDMESAQWVGDVATQSQIPFIVLEKIRRGDREVEVSVPNVERWKDHTPVLVDDIISTGHTMLKTIAHLKKAGMKPPVCIGIHGIFAENAFAGLKAAGAQKILSCNTIAHVSNQIDVSEIISDKIKSFLIGAL